MGLLSFAIDTGAAAEARSILAEAKDEALSTMESMIVNPGQESVYNDYILPQFISASRAPAEDGWEDMDAGDYSDFMSEIVEEGNSIMEAAYDEAASILEEANLSADDSGDFTF